ncbi:hypothetical protein K505DRAFT_319211 [Melanomma pulvis-pyrius CBS 109.77]|uniref:N-acetyltransferase domain-containing protein n=1 Tax=Melanomma pulvis-pyrius CBS 109.77 TaxID=1314802 RepID=A0A6A6WPY6_9PLEO|nr:hypothetical protein K505DRAFT_319211 [Melanomma pulvis-pyrius CBS 109.77]
MDPTISTSRLLLTRLTNTALDSEHLKWFHEIWTDNAATAWSLHGKCTTLASSQEWMVQQLTIDDNMLYAIHVKPDPTSDASDVCSDPTSTGVLVGNIDTEIGVPGSTTSLNFRVMGYSFFESAWGKGYATEAGSALIASYAAFRATAKETEGGCSYIEASVDQDNPASMKVLVKLGFKEVGLKIAPEKVFLAGDWRGPGYWIYGQYV